MTSPNINTTSTSTTSLRIDVDSIARALHVPREAFLRAANRSNEEADDNSYRGGSGMAAAATTGQPREHQLQGSSPPQRGVSPNSAGYGGGLQGAASEGGTSAGYGTTSAGGARSYLSGAGESDALLGGHSAPSQGRFRDHAPQTKTLSVKSVIHTAAAATAQQQQQQQQQTQQGQQQFLDDGITPTPNSGGISSSSQPVPIPHRSSDAEGNNNSLHAATTIGGRSISDAVPIVIPPEVRQQMMMQQQQTQPAGGNTGSFNNTYNNKSNRSGLPVLSNLSDRGGAARAQRSSAVLSGKEVAIETAHDGQLRMRFAESSSSSDNDDDEDGRKKREAGGSGDDDDDEDEDNGSGFHQRLVGAKHQRKRRSSITGDDVRSGGSNESMTESSGPGQSPQIRPATAALAPRDVSAQASSLDPGGSGDLNGSGGNSSNSMQQRQTSGGGDNDNNSPLDDRSENSAVYRVLHEVPARSILHKKNRAGPEHSSAQLRRGGSNLSAATGTGGQQQPPSQNTSAREKKKKKRRVQFAEDVIDNVKLEHGENGGVIVKVAFRRPSWLFWLLTFSVIVGAAGWYLVVSQAARATLFNGDMQHYAVLKIAAVRSWAMLLTAFVGFFFAFPPRSSDWAFARDPGNIIRLLFVAVLSTGANVLVYLGLMEQLALTALLGYSLLPLTLIVSMRFGLSLLGLSSAITTWFDKVSATAALIGAVILPIRYNYSAESGIALALAAAASACRALYAWKSKSLRPYFSQGIVVVTVAILSTIVFTVPMAMEKVQDVQIPYFPPDNMTGSNVTATTTTTTTTTPVPEFEPTPPPTNNGNSKNKNNRHILFMHMDSDAFILALLSGVCEGMRLYSQGLVSGFLDVPAQVAFNALGCPVFMLFFAAQGLEGMGVAISVSVSVVMAMVVAVQLYFGEAHRRETHLHLSAVPRQMKQGEDDGIGVGDEAAGGNAAAAADDQEDF